MKSATTRKLEPGATSGERTWARRWLSWIKLAFGLSLLAVLVASVDTGRILTVLGRADWVWVAAAFGFFLLISGLEGLRLWLVFLDSRTPLAYSVRVFFESLVFINLLPGTLGGDGYMVMRFRHAGLAPALTRIFFIRLLGAGVIGVLGLLALPFWNGAQGFLALVDGAAGTYSRVVTWFVVALALAPLVAVALPAVRRWVRIVAWRVFDAFRAITVKQHALLLSATTVMQVLRAGMFGSLVLAVGGEPTLALGLILAAAGLISMLLPLTFSGLGIREGAIAGVLVVSGAVQEEALAVALLARVLLIAGALVGGVSLLLPGLEHRDGTKLRTFS